mgnify:CR=1 FL=1
MSCWPSASRWTRADTPLGDVVVVADHGGLRSIAFADVDPACGATRADAELEWLAAAVRNWFDGDATIESMPVHLEVTPFQRAVLDELRRIPAGDRRSYARVAEAVGRPTATRAVGQACGRNPVALAIPCHRVVRADGAPGGYAWGLERKVALLALEATDR